MSSIHSTRGRDTVASVLRHQAARHAQEPFLAFERSPGVIEETTWAEMLIRAERAAGALHRLGVNPGDRFSVHLSNSPEFFDAWFGAAILGAAMVPSDPRCTAEELASYYEHAGCRISVTQPDLRDVAWEASGGRVTVVSIDEPWIKEDDIAPRVDVSPADVLGVLYSNSETGRPRGVLVTHAAYLHGGDAVAEHIRLQPSDRMLVVLPMFHSNAQCYSTMSALVTGASLALVPRLSAARWTEQATFLGATVTSLFADSIRMLLATEPSEFDRVHALRICLIEQNVTDDELATFEDRFDVLLARLHGVTEAVAPVTMSPIFGERRGGSIGRPLSSTRLRVVDVNGNDVAVGEPGELQVAGQLGLTLMLGYLDNPAATAAVVQDGWLRTGHSVRLDEDGYLYLNP